MTTMAIKSFILKYVESGEAADCVIEVMPEKQEDDDGQNKVYPRQ
jgi:hypothetical protein